MLKRTYVVLPFLVALVVLLAACGGGATPTTAPTEAIEPTAQATDQAAGETMSQSADERTSVAAATSLPRVEVQVTPTTQALLAPVEIALTTVDVVKILTPSVVHILTEISGMGSFNQAVPSQGVGTGIVLDKQGNILTNNHVIAGAQSITVTLNNGESFPA